MSQPIPATTINPYAAPQVTADHVAPQLPEGDFPGVWRHRNVLVVLRQSPLPPICLKSGRPATQWLRRDLRWHEPWIFLTLLLGWLPGILVYAILAYNKTKRAALMMGLSDEWAARRRTRMITAAAIALAGIAAGVAGCLLNGERQNEGWLLLLPVALVTLIGAAIYNHYACRLVWPQRITDQYIFLRGVHSDVLDQMPEWLD
jgi:hypothetical protein